MREGQSELSGQLGAICARPEQPYFGHGAPAWDGRDRAVRMTVGEPAPEERQELGEQFRIVLVSAPDGVSCDRVFPGRPAQAEVDPTGAPGSNRRPSPLARRSPLPSWPFGLLVDPRHDGGA